MGFEIARRLTDCNHNVVDQPIAAADEIASMLQGLRKSLKKISEHDAIYTTDQTPQLTTNG